VTLGAGMFIGAWISGRAVEAHTLGPAAHDWWTIWMIPAAAAAAVMVLFAVLFKAGVRATPAATLAATGPQLEPRGGAGL
jgi:hypothetical protein